MACPCQLSRLRAQWLFMHEWPHCRPYKGASRSPHLRCMACPVTPAPPAQPFYCLCDTATVPYFSTDHLPAPRATQCSRPWPSSRTKLAAHRSPCFSWLFPYSSVHCPAVHGRTPSSLESPARRKNYSYPTARRHCLDVSHQPLTCCPMHLLLWPTLPQYVVMLAIT